MLPTETVIPAPLTKDQLYLGLVSLARIIGGDDRVVKVIAAMGIHEDHFKDEDCIAWGQLEQWVRYAARDKDGVVAGFEHRPKMGFAAWRAASTGKSINHLESISGLIRVGSRGWQNSLVQRPE